MILKRKQPKQKFLKDFYVFDVETADKVNDMLYWNLTGEFQFGVIYGYEFVKIIHSKDEFIKEFENPVYKKKKFFAHNAEFDLMVLYGNIIKNLDNKALYSGSRFISATNGNVVFADSMNIINHSVEIIGKQIGIKKPELGTEFKSKFISRNEINRCVKDCEIIWKALFSFFEFAGEIKITQAGLSMEYFRRFHQPFDIEYNHNVKYFRESYFGGRTECFKVGKTNAFVFDINSMYSYSMLHCVFPNPKFLKYERKPKQFDIYKFEGCGNFTVEHPESYFGLLPLKHNDKLIFPVGRFSGTWNFNELRFAVQHGVKVIKCNWVCYSVPMESPFISFVETLNALKIKAEVNENEFERNRYKILMNSLYGKFAQQVKPEQIYIEDYEKEFDKIQEYQKSKQLVEIKMFSKNRKDCFLLINSKRKVVHSIPLFSSYITSFARVLLLNSLIQYKNYIPVYCDTDSIFFELLPPIKTSNELGQWKLENKFITEIKGLKNYKYIVNNKLYEKIKGVPSTEKDFYYFDGKTIKKDKRCIKISENEFEYFTLIKSKSALRQNKKERSIIKVKKVNLCQYDKRVIIENGNTLPICL